MGKRKKKGNRRKNLAISAFGLGSVADRYETAPLHQRKFEETDMVWLADEYRRRSSSEASLTLEDFAGQYGMPVDELRAYIPELGGGINRSVILWHGTSKSRAESIRREGFRPRKGRAAQKGRTFFTRNRAVACGYAERRADLEKDQPAVIMCSIDLNRYNDYERRGNRIFAFTADCISRDVVRNVTGLERQRREKPEKRRDANVEPTNVALTFSSGLTGIAYWINSYVETRHAVSLRGQDRIDEEHEAVVKIKQWLDEQANAGRFGEVPDDEMLEQVREYLPQHLPQ